MERLTQLHEQIFIHKNGFSALTFTLRNVTKTQHSAGCIIINAVNLLNCSFSFHSSMISQTIISGHGRLPNMGRHDKCLF